MKIPKPPKSFMMIDMSLIKRLELWLFMMPELLKIRPNTFAMLKIPKLKLWLLRLSVCERLQLWKRDPKMLFSRYVRDDSFYRPGQPNCEYTMWKFQDFSATHILREINFGHFEASKTAILTIWAILNFKF